MSIENSIKKMYSEICAYNGDFGDPIVEQIDFAQLGVLRGNRKENIVGAGIALLVLFCSHIDNATYDDALNGEAAREIQIAINEGLCESYPELQLSLESVFSSEKEFISSLSEVYKTYVQRGPYRDREGHC